MIRVRVVIKNTGQTPASHLRTTAELFFGKLPLDTEPPPLKPTAALTSVGVLGRDEPTEHWVHKDFSTDVAADIQSVVQGNLAIYVRGRIDYVDIFGAPCETIFRFNAGGYLGLHPDGAMMIDIAGNDIT